MSKTILLLTFFLLSCGLPLCAIDHYQVGDTLYVCARSGLILRAGPDKNGAKITTIPYGDFILTKDSKASGNDSNVEIGVQTGWLCYSDPTDSIGKKQINLNGRWAKDKLEVTTGENTWFSVRQIGNVCIFLFSAED